MKNTPIDKFGTKLMASSKSVNKIPYENLSYAQNLRIYDGGIGPRLGYKSVYEGGQGFNQGGFSMNGSLYQVEGGKIYKIDISDESRTEIETIGYEDRIDVLVYQNTRGDFTSLGTETVNFTGVYLEAATFKYENNILIIRDLNNNLVEVHTLVNDNTGFAIPAIKLLQTGSTTFRGGFDAGDGIVLTDNQVAYPNSFILSGSFDIQVGSYATTETAIISSNGRDVKVFDGETVTDVIVDNTGIIEFSAGRSWLSASNILLASRPVTLLNPGYAYDFAGAGSYNIVYDSNIQGLKATLGGLYVFTESKVEYISSGNSAAGLSLPLGEGANPVNNLCIVSSGDKIFYLTQNLDIETVNYTPGINDAQVGKISARSIVNIKEYLNTLDTEQPTAFACNNKNENTIQFFVRTQGAQFNNVCIVYDLVNDTWNVDTGRYFNTVINHDNTYYAFSDITTSVYKDYSGYTDNGGNIDIKGVTQAMSFNTPNQKLFGGFYIAGAISALSSLDFNVEIDETSVFQDTLQTDNIIMDGGVGSDPLGGNTVGGGNISDNRFPFNIQADEGRIWLYGDRVKLEFSNNTDVQNWILDTLGIRLEMSQNINIENKF